MKEMEQSLLSVQEIKELIGALDKHHIGKLRLRQGEFELELEGAGHGAVPTPPAPLPAVPLGLPEELRERTLAGNVVKSPIVGTFYAAPAPDQAPYVTVGTKVKKGDVLFIIESMKLMNEVTSEYDGTVSEILLENAAPVEYGQPILCIE